MNLMPYSVYKQLGLGELKPTNITLSLADRSVKIPKGIVEDVLVKIDKFYYPVDFVVLDTEPIASEPNHVPIILGRPFLATANAIINFRNGVMQLTFGNKTMELNIFHLNNKHELLETENQISDEVVSIGQCAGKQSTQEVQGVISQEDEEILVLPTTPTASQLINSKAISKDHHTDDIPAPEPEIQRSPAPQMSPSSPPPYTTSAATTDTPGPSYSVHHSPEYIHASSREIAGVMDAICSLATTQAAQDQRLAQCHSMLTRIMIHLGLPRDPDQREEPTTDATSLDVLAAAAAASDPPPPQQ